jgi:hypothetical protein
MRTLHPCAAADNENENSRTLIIHVHFSNFSVFRNRGRVGRMRHNSTRSVSTNASRQSGSAGGVSVASETEPFCRRSHTDDERLLKAAVQPTTPSDSMQNMPAMRH